MVPGNKIKNKKVVLKEEWSQVLGNYTNEVSERKREERDFLFFLNDTPFRVQIVKVLGEEEKGFIKKKLS